MEAFEDRIYLLFPLAIQPPIEWSSYQSLRNSVIPFLIVSRSALETCILYRLKLFSGANKKSNGKEGEKKRRRGISNRVTSQREQTKENEREKEREREREERAESGTEVVASVTSLSQRCLRVSCGHIRVERSVKNEHASAHKA